MKSREQDNKFFSQTFLEFTADFLKKINPETVVEIGPDSRLSVARRLSPLCQDYYAIVLPRDVTASFFCWQSLIKEGRKNIELIGMNALQLSERVPQAEVIILHNVLLDLTGEDTALLWKYRRGEVPYTDKEWNELTARFDQAEEQGYMEFLRVANPGYIIIFTRPNNADKVLKLLERVTNMDQEKIVRMSLYHDDVPRNEGPWEAIIVKNTP